MTPNYENFDYEMFNYNEFIESNPSFDDVRALLNCLDTARYYRIEEFEYIEKEYDILVNYENDNLLSYIEEDICKVAHLVLNNAFFIISNGAEFDFTYELTEEDKKNYRFQFGEMKHLAKAIYGGYQGTIDFIFDDGKEVPDDYFDAQDMHMLATFFYDEVAKKM